MDIERGYIMSLGFNWFKTYKIEIIDEAYCYRVVKLTYLDGASTSHSGFNIEKVQDLIEDISGSRIPTICEDFIESEDDKLELIEPSEMSEICEKILSDTKCDEVDMRDRIEWFKDLADEGYYFSYDYF